MKWITEVRLLTKETQSKKDEMVGNQNVAVSGRNRLTRPG